MSIQNTVTKCQYVGNGNTTVFPYTFTLSPKHPEYVVVYITGEDGTTATTNNVTIDTAAQSVTYPADGSAPLAVGEKITIARFVPYKQILNLVNQGPFFAEDIETELDEIVSMIQQLAEANDRCLKSNISEDTEVDWTLPVAQPGYIFCWSEDGKSLVNVDIEAIVQRAETAVTEAAEQVDLAAAQTEKAKAQAETAKSQAEAAAASAAEAAAIVDPAAVDRKINAHNDDPNAHAARFRSPLMMWTSGTAYAVNDIVVDDNKIWMCVTPNNDVDFDKNKWVNIGGGGGGSGSGSGSGRNLGEILWLSANDADAIEGSLIADGAEVSRTMYPDLNALYASKGYPWGDGDGATTFNLPNLIGRFAEGAETAGGYHEAGLPNITGTFNYATCFSSLDDITSSGAFTHSKLGDGCRFNSGYSSPNGVVNLDASRSSSTYGASDTVQPPSALLLPYVVVFTNATADSSLVDMTQYDQDLAKKANRDLSNLTPTGQAKLGTTVVESYHDEQGNWWRKYSDGWLEQGGCINCNGMTHTYLYTVALLKPFETVYSVQGTAEYDNSTQRVCPVGIKPTSNNTTIMLFSDQYVGSKISGRIYWTACGMGANV